MPCSLTSDADYPDYLKSILKEIESGKDKELKNCACGLRSPVDEDGCTITDEDGKVVAFPFCLAKSAPGGGVISNIGLSYKQAMSLFWKPIKNESINFIIKTKGGPCKCGLKETGYIQGNTNVKSDPRDLKGVFCYNVGIGLEIANGDDPRATKRIDLGCSYGSSDYYLGLVIGIYISYNESRAWIDTSAKKIYPYMGAAVNLGCDCVSNITLAGGKINGSTVIMDLAGSDCGGILNVAPGEGTIEFNIP